MTGDYGALIRKVGLGHYLAQFDARKMTKTAILEELEQVAKELLAANRMRRDAEEAIENIECNLREARRDCRRAEEVADEYIRRLEEERRAHEVTTQQAARALHGQSMIFGRASRLIGSVEVSSVNKRLGSQKHERK